MGEVVSYTKSAIDALVAGAGGGGGGGTNTPGSTKVLITNLLLGQVLGSSTDHAWYEIPNVCERGLLSRFAIASNDLTSFEFELRDFAEIGELWLAADGISNSYDISAPVYIEGGVDKSLWVGIKNTGLTAQTFILQTLRVEAFA